MTPTPITTPTDVVTAAMGIAEDIAQGRLSPAALEQQLVTELRELFGTVVGEGDPVWTLHQDVARQAISLGGIPIDELREWVAVLARRAGEPVSLPEPLDRAETLMPAESAGSAALSPESEATVRITETVQAAAVSATEPAAVVTPLRRAESGGDYDPLRGFDPGGTRRR